MPATARMPVTPSIQYQHQKHEQKQQEDMNITEANSSGDACNSRDAPVSTLGILGRAVALATAGKF